MTTKKRENQEGRNPLSVPAQEDEEDIVEEVHAEPDEETGSLAAEVDRVREVGALDPASVRQNRHINRVADKKRKGEKVSFGIDDPIVLYEALNKVWPNDKVDVHATNLVTREVHIIRSHPRSGADLYELLRGIHGPREAQEYKVEFRSSSRKEYLGQARLTMPDARPSPSGPQGQPPYYPPPPQYASLQAAPPQTPPVPQAPPSPHGTDPMQMVQQVLDVAERLRAQMTPPQAPQQPPQAPYVPPQGSTDPMQTVQQVLDIAERLRAQTTPQPQAPQAPLPPPPASSDPTAILNWALQAVQKLQPAPQAAQPQQAMPMGMPPFAPPPGTTWMYAPGPNGSPGGWIAQPLGAGVGVGGAQPRSPFQRPAYYPQGDPNDRAPAQRAAPERSPIQAFRESVSMMRDARNVAQEFSDIFGGAGSGSEPAEVAEDDDDSPIKIIETGHGKLAVNRSDGALRWAETGLMLLPDVLKWVGEQHDKIQEAQRQKQQPQPRRVLPEGYVEVDQNYKPPRGFVAVPVEQDDLPPPPSNVPPAIDEQEEEPRPTWGAPVIPQNG